MRWIVAALACSLTACSSSPTTPSPPPPPVVDHTAPAILTLGFLAGTGPGAGSALIVATVQTVTGDAVPGLTVRFATDRGTLTADRALTDDHGRTQTLLTANDTATVTGTVGTLSRQILVAAEPAPFIPPPSPPSPPSVPPTAVPRTMTATCTPATVTVGSSLTCTAQVVDHGADVSLQATYQWDFDESTPASTPPVFVPVTATLVPTVTHTYLKIGAYIVTVIGRVPSGETFARAAITVQ